MFDKVTDKKDVKGILLKFLKYWPLYVAGAAIAVLIAVIYLRYATPMYSASTSLLFKGEKGAGGPSEGAAFSDIALFSSGSSMENEILILKSYSLMEKVVERMEMKTTFVIEGTVRDVEVYGKDMQVKILTNEYSPAFYGKSFMLHFTDSNRFELEDDSVTVEYFGQEITKPYGKFTVVVDSDFSPSSSDKPVQVKFNNLQSLARSYANRLSVSPVNKAAQALNISITDPIPRRAADLLAALVETYEEVTIEDKNKIAEKTVQFIDDRLTFLTEELSRVEQNVELYKQQNELTDVGSQAEQFVAAAGENRKEIEAINIQLEVLKSIETYLQGQEAGSFELVPSTLTLTDATLNGLIAKFNELQLDRERMLRTTKPNNPIILNINGQLSNLRDNILENLRNIKNGLTITRRNLMVKSGMVGDQIQMVPVIERQLIEITRQQEIKKALYLYLLQKKEESSLSLAATVSNVRLIDPPISKGPISPNKTNILAYSFLLGLFIPVLGVYIKNLLNTTIESKQDIESATETPILGEVCHDQSLGEIVAKMGENTPIAEMFRLLRANLHFAAGGKDNKVFLVTSSMSGEGKTFFSMNLGYSLAGAGKRVLLVEFDLRRPTLSRRLQLGASKGVTDYLVGDVEDIDTLITQSADEKNLFVLPAGSIPPNPAEILMSPEVGNLLASMREKYDNILLDCPPVGKVADAYTLNDYIDAALYVVRRNVTQKEQLRIVDDIFQKKQMKKVLIVFNDAKQHTKGAYAYGY
jgi:capsular exopolysaccharide synthesis family protein